MGNRKKNKKNKKTNRPFVSICTPTFNRRPFISAAIKCYLHQTYPKSCMEWIIIDDGTDAIKDLVENVEGVKYYYYEKKMPLGEKRNIMHKYAKGEIIVYMDDDDYYPPERVEHAVKTLKANPQALCAGSSVLYIWFKHLGEMWQFGPYGKNHATAATFAFWKRLLKQTKYDDTAALAEERAFLKDYTIPFVQLDPLKSILVVSHNHNTFDKKKLLDKVNPDFVKKSSKTVDMFIKETDLKKFYMEDIEKLLDDYSPGEPTMKPDVLMQMLKTEEKRRIRAENLAEQAMQRAGQQGKITRNNADGTQKVLSNEEVLTIITTQESQIQKLKALVQSLITDNQLLRSKKREIEDLSRTGTVDSSDVDVQRCKINDTSE
jgi:glycosyltransferase involved in cell wall biosynthesis